ncbi:MAG: metalloregulator ArsR/SmtB family transcription factor [Chlorobi bacterium]|nr:metalloregulator ArsR/SmtB family transcription factor [Chlorobiota bacterium]MCI0716866.1 metalloregulator ArsR/SmtB family transcription factor [Chlorobiota bacterium]
MGITKTDNFSQNQNELANFAKAIGHPARVAIIEYLLSSNKCVCGDIVDVIPLAQATVSQHLKELKLAGLIKGNIEGNAVCYCIDQENWNKFKEMLDVIFNKLENSNCCT